MSLHRTAKIERLDATLPSKLLTPLARHGGDEPGTISVLHVDDDRDIVELVAEFLERIDDQISVSAETEVESAIDSIADEPVDCIVSDYQMPERDGLDFLEVVRPEYPRLPFILFTGQGSEEIASTAITKGVTDYVQKGGGREQYEVLVNRIRNAVEAFRTEHELWTTLSWYQRLVEQNLAGIYLIQQEEFVYVNERLADIFGYPQDELIGASPTELVAEADHGELRENLRRREAGEVDNIHYSMQGIRKDGSSIDIEVHGGHVSYDSAPAVMGVLLER